MRPSAPRWLEWMSCGAIHYSGIDRLIGPLHRRRGRTVSILMYHRVHPDGPGPRWRLTQSAFHAQLLHLTRRYNVLPLGEAVEMLAEGETLPPRAVVVTFDDGYRDNYTHAFPVILETLCPTTIFLTAGLIGTRETLWWDQLLHAVRETQVGRVRMNQIFEQLGLSSLTRNGPDLSAAVLALKRRPENEILTTVDAITLALGIDPRSNVDDFMMSWSEAREMADSGLITMGAHSMTHRNLKKLDLDEARDEIAHSKRVIEEQLERPVDFFAYPFGDPVHDFTDEVKAIVRDVGYKGGLTVVFGIAEHGTDLFAIPRFCESSERWQAPHGRFSRALFDSYLTGAREHLGDLRPGRWFKRSA